MGSAFITTTCSKLLLWFVLLLMLRLRPRPIQLLSMELTAMLGMLPHTHTAMLDIHMPTPPSPDTAPPTELTPWESPESPQLPPPLLPEDTPLPEDTSPTLPELSMLPRERLRLMPMLMLTTDTTDMPDLMLTVLDTEATDTDTHMLTTERDLLMLSQRPRLMPLSSTEPMDMLVSRTLDTLPMVLTHMPTELTHAYGAYYGKRSADAEPEADAYYGYYGYARPYSYGYAPYAYGAYPYGYGYAWGK